MNRPRHPGPGCARSQPRRSAWRWPCALGVLVLAGIGGVLVARFAATPVPTPPVVASAGFDPAIAAAVDRARQEVLRSPRSAGAWGRMGMVLLAHDLHSEAGQCLVQASALAPREPRWPYLLGVATEPLNPKASVAHLDRAVRLLAADPPGESDRSVAARLRLANTWMELGRLDEAEAIYREVRDGDPASAPAALGLGKIAQARGQLAEAVELLARAKGHPTTRRSAHRLLVSVHQRLSQTREVAELTRILNALPADEAWPDPFLAEVEALKTGANAGLDRADAWIQAGRVADAARLLEQLVQQYPDSDRAWFLLGRARHRLGDLAQAESALRNSIAMSPGKIEAQVQLGVLHLAKGQAAAAEQCFRAALRAKPNLAEGWYNLGLALGGTQRANAIEAFREAIRLKPTLMQAYLGLAVVLRAEGRAQEASDVLDRALALCPEGPMRQRLLEQRQALRPP